MNIGFLTNSLVEQGLDDINKISEWAAVEGFECLEVGPNVPFSNLEQVIKEGNINIAALTYCRNFLSSDDSEAEAHQKELIYRIKKAGELNIPMVVTSTGIADVVPSQEDAINAIRTMPEASLDKVARLFEKVLRTAEKENVKIAFENCPLMGNIAISPKTLRLLFEKLNSSQAGLAYDPSHFVWQFIDPYLPIAEFGDRIFHVHAKDTEINRDDLNNSGILTDFSWWDYRLPGLGELNWSKLFQELTKSGYHGVISIEHEDPVWSGNLERTKEALVFSKNYIEYITSK
ncbi:sugar phosphate isomerase/epimerase [Halobacillus salinarum]|uniref:Sugar phosphate isomerase/epimerase n=1 Tax=Halobacillus salinarum TaxID=2932257 RepID=A0ABY4EJG3_9BACI|nr:sugar phosphate isomerase/epimerase [Halobacillus salinarum]UOQ44105.1 sugar phosphate isomerase/epimerase [Halobacillus salinarum]